MSMSRNPYFSLVHREANRLLFVGDGSHIVHVFVLEEDVLRVLLLPGGDLRGSGWDIALRRFFQLAQAAIQIGEPLRDDVRQILLSRLLAEASH